MGWMNLKFPSICRGCQTKLPAGTMADYSSVARSVVACRSCPAAGSVAAKEIDTAYEAMMKRLDPDQRGCTTWREGDGNYRWLAGAGSGKTATTVATTATLLRNGFAPESIILTTFTNKAGRELADRARKVIPPALFSRLRIGTFHSLALRSLGRLDRDRWDNAFNLDAKGETRMGGIPSSGQLWATVMGEDPIEVLGKIPGCGLDLKKFEPRDYAMAADVIRSKGLTQASKEAQALALLVEKEQGLSAFWKAWTLFEKAKRELGAWDFADALQAYHDEIQARRLPDRARLIFVDEAQDNSKLQLAIARLLARDGGAVIIVGDLSQAIYGWRGADPEIFEHAPELLGAKDRQIRYNYRSGKAIVELGNRVCKDQPWKIGDPSIPARDVEGKVSVLGGFGLPEDEADAIAEQISAAIDEGSAELQDFAVLARTNAALALLETSMMKHKVPCAVVGGSSFFNRREVADCTAYLKLSMSDDMDAFKRVVNRSGANVPRRFLGPAFVASVTQHMREKKSLVEAVALAKNGVQKENGRLGAEELLDVMTQLKGMSYVEAASFIASYMTPAPKETAEDEELEADDDRAGIYAAFKSVAEMFESAEELELFAARCAGKVVSVPEKGDMPKGRVILSTVHRAKGLEWRHVFVLASKGSFPSARADNAKRLAEERRLFYVAVTRAMDSLTLTWASTNLFGMEAGPSEWLVMVDGTDVPAPDDASDFSDYDEEYDERPQSWGGAVTSFDTVMQAAQEAHDNLLGDHDDEAEDDQFDHEAERETLRDMYLLEGGEEAALAGRTEAQHNAFVREAAQRQEAAARPQVAAVPPQPQVATQQRETDHRAPSFMPGLAKIFTHLPDAEAIAAMRVDPGAGRGYVPVRANEMAELLAPLGFSDAPIRDFPTQRVYRAYLGEGVAIHVYSTIPVGAEESRSVGEDSIKVAITRTDDDGKVRPLMSRQPYATRTKNWRGQTLARIRECAGIFTGKRCVCGSCLITRQRRDKSGSFEGCMLWPDCPKGGR